MAINTGATRNDFMASCLRELWLWCARYEILLRAQHLPGIDNRLADYLSRWHIRPAYYSQKFHTVLEHSLTEVSIANDIFEFQCTW